MKTLESQMVVIDKLTTNTIEEMFSLYNEYYEATSPSIFLKDLYQKNWAILLYDKQKKLKGFTTIALLNSTFKGEKQRVLYSGDTIIHHEYWGQHQLAIAWLKFSGYVKAMEPNVPLYWLLMVKGYRTYRYLSAFCQQYYPTPSAITPAPIKELMNALAEKQFGNAYDALTGLVKFPESHGHLRPLWADIPEASKARPDVAYFLKANPHFDKGDELICLCELAANNLKPFAKRIFLAGAPVNHSEFV